MKPAPLPVPRAPNMAYLSEPPPPTVSSTCAWNHHPPPSPRRRRIRVFTGTKSDERVNAFELVTGPTSGPEIERGSGTRLQEREGGGSSKHWS